MSCAQCLVARIGPLLSSTNTLASFSAVGYGNLGSENDAKVLFDINGHTVAVKHCAQLAPFDIRNTSRFLLINELDCGEGTEVCDAGKMHAETD